MPSTYSTSLKLELIQNGEQSGIWGQSTNKNLQLIEQSIAGVTDLYLVGDATLTTFNGLPDEARSAVISCTGLLAAPANVIAPSVQKTYIVTNNTGANVTIKTSTGNGVTVLNTNSTLVYCDGTDFYEAVSIGNVIGDQTISGNEVIGGNVTAYGNLTVTSNITSYTSSLALLSNTSIVTAANNTGAYIPPTGTTAQRPTAPNGGMSRFNTDAGVYEIFNGAVWQPITGAYSVSYIVVAGGGGGGIQSFQGSGGGGAGGLLANVSSVQPNTAYSIIIGSGGATNANGTATSAFGSVAIGGGSGAGANLTSINGGSGGGKCTRDNPDENFGPGSGTAGQGYAGSSGISGYVGAGGGGAAQIGQGINGGNGASSTISGVATYYAGGGGGGDRQGGPGGSGGLGGGGSRSSGTANTGGGGAGGGSDPGAYGGGNGGSGICIISYPSATQRATGGTVTTYTSGGQVYWVHTFTSSGTFTA